MNKRYPTQPSADEDRTASPASTGAGPAKLNELARLGRLVGPLIKEIRAPLGNLMAASEMLSEGAAENDPTSGFIRLMYRESERIQRTVSDLAILAAPPPLEPRAVDVVPLLEDVLREVEPAAAEQGIRLHEELPSGALYVWADPDGLRTALRKLPEHAVDSMPYGGTLSVSVGRTAGLLRRWVRVVLSDTGPGVPADGIAKMFEPFIMTEGRRPGMSLALCRMLVEQMGGRAAVRSNGEQGLTVEVLLPVPPDASDLCRHQAGDTCKLAMRRGLQ